MKLNRLAAVIIGAAAVLTASVATAGHTWNNYHWARTTSSFTLQVIDPKEQLQLLDKSRLRDITVLKTSTMPSYRDKLSAQELADVVSYLASLRGRP